MPHFIFCCGFDDERIIDYGRKSSVTPKAFSVYKNINMFSLCFSGSKFLLNLRRQFSVRKIFSCTYSFFVHKFWQDLQS